MLRELDEQVSREGIGAAELEVPGLTPVLLVDLVLGQIVRLRPPLHAVDATPVADRGVQVLDYEAELVKCTANEPWHGLAHLSVPPYAFRGMRSRPCRSSTMAAAHQARQLSGLPSL